MATGASGMDRVAPITVMDTLEKWLDSASGHFTMEMIARQEIQSKKVKTYLQATWKRKANLSLEFSNQIKMPLENILCCLLLNNGEPLLDT